MESNRDLLIEIGTEELPPMSLKPLSDSFKKAFERELLEQRLSFGAIEAFATPRRLALLVRELPTRQPDLEKIRKGPALRTGIDEQGKPTKAAQGFARSCGVSVEDLETQETGNGSWLVYRQVQQGVSTASLIQVLTEKALSALPIAKRMRWGDRDEEFVRPVHWVTFVFGQQMIKGRLFGIDAGNNTRGHRFHHPQELRIESASDYVQTLTTQGKVEPRFSVRRDMIRTQVDGLAAKAGGKALVTPALLEEVTGLCEWPCALLGEFDEDFLKVPSEVLIETMQKNQKYFPVTSTGGALLPKFVTVSNIESQKPSQVREGNERVIRPRFADAAFFFRQDLKKSLDEFAPGLKHVLFQEQLGTLADKTARVVQIARHVAGILGSDEALVARAAELAKCDLLTEMVSEFPGLQGVMGRYYAEKAGEHRCVAAAMQEQYLPRHAGDEIPHSDCGAILSIADRIDTLVGIFAIGQRPSGAKDPYALRRAAIGVLRILIESPLRLDLYEVLNFAAEELRHKVDAHRAAGEVFDYCMDRLKAYYADRNVAGDVVDSILAVQIHTPSDIHQRVNAVQDFRLLPEADSLAAANKRIQNILRKSSADGAAAGTSNSVDPSVLREEAELRLARRITELQSRIRPLLKAKEYTRALKLLSGLREDIDFFFHEVMVMAEQESLRRNRLALIRSVQELFLQVADISLLR